MTLNDICELIVDCPHSTAKDEGEGYPLIRTPNIGRGRLILNDVHRVSKEVYDKRNARAVPQDDDLILAREAPAGNVAIVKNGEKVCLGQRTVLLRPDRNKVYPDFLAYYILAPEQQYELLGTANGATVAHVNIPVIKSLPVSLPDMDAQKKAADILKAYDDLIDNNQEKIKLLEEAAQRLYKEWFVNLHFPNYEIALLADGIPENWKRTTMSEVCDSIGGGTPSTARKEYYDGGTIKWVTPTDLTKDGSLILLDTEKKITESGLANSSAKLLPPNTILMTSRASIGYFALCEDEVCTNQGFISCIPFEENMRFYLLFNLMDRVDEIKGKATGSTFLEIAKRTFRSMGIVVPDDKTLDAFTSVISPIIDKMRITKKEMQELEMARDRLLPKLMSGEIKL